MPGKRKALFHDLMLPPLIDSDWYQSQVLYFHAIQRTIQGWPKQIEVACPPDCTREMPSESSQWLSLCARATDPNISRGRLFFSTVPARQIRDMSDMHGFASHPHHQSSQPGLGSPTPQLGLQTNLEPNGSPLKLCVQSATFC